MQKANGVFSDYSTGNCRKYGCLSTRVVTFTNTSPILLQVRLEVGNLLGILHYQSSAAPYYSLFSSEQGHRLRVEHLPQIYMKEHASFDFRTASFHDSEIRMLDTDAQVRVRGPMLRESFLGCERTLTAQIQALL